MFSAAKASERARARLVSSAKKNHIKGRHFGANYLRPCRVCDDDDDDELYSCVDVFS